MASGSGQPRKSSAEKPIPHTRIQDDNMIKDNYDVGIKLGQGNFGKVYAATHRETGIKWAIKSINKEKAGSSALKLVEREVAILKRVNHAHIINLNEVIESPKRMYLVMEVCDGGELAEVLAKRNTFSEAETKIIIQKLASAISYLHKHGIVHRDLKLENILLADNPVNPTDHLHVKITDFGLSVVKGGVTHDTMMQDFCGTPIYMAPEILDNKAYSQQCDVWALGVIMYYLLSGHAPFRSNDEGGLYDLIREAKVEFDDPVWSGISEDCKNCILGMLKVDPAHRLSAAEVQNHPWITGEQRDSNQPANVLEMMKLWKDELKHETIENDRDDLDAVNGSPDSPDHHKGQRKHSVSHASRRGSHVQRKSIADGKISPDHHVSKAKLSVHPGKRSLPSTSTAISPSLKKTETPKTFSSATVVHKASPSGKKTPNPGTNVAKTQTPTKTAVQNGNKKK